MYFLEKVSSLLSRDAWTHLCGCAHSENLLPVIPALVYFPIIVYYSSLMIRKPSYNYRITVPSGTKL